MKIKERSSNAFPIRLGTRNFMCPQDGFSSELNRIRKYEDIVTISVNIYICNKLFEHTNSISAMHKVCRWKRNIGNLFVKYPTEKQVVIAEIVLMIHTEVILNESAHMPRSQLNSKPNSGVYCDVALDNCVKNTLVDTTAIKAEIPITTYFNCV